MIDGTLAAQRVGCSEDVRDFLCQMDSPHADAGAQLKACELLVEYLEREPDKVSGVDTQSIVRAVHARSK